METHIRLLRSEEIECRVATVNEKGLSLLLYKDARTDQNILDETFSPWGWQRTHQSINGHLFCTVKIWDSEKLQWIEKQDLGTASYAEKEKGEASDSFKRACVNVGIGRELYTAPFIWIPAHKVNICKKGEKLVTTDVFRVSAIAYNNQREISFLKIEKNNGSKVFTFDNRVSQGNHLQAETKGKVKENLSEAQLSMLKQELLRTGVSLDAVLSRYNLKRIEDMSQEMYMRAMQGLKRTKAKAA